MPSRLIFVMMACVGCLVIRGVDGAQAGESAAKVSLTAAEVGAIKSYLQTLRGCCMDDGSIVMVNHGPDALSPVWVAPYFGDHVALALIAANAVSKNDGDMARVRAWIEWRVKHQEPGGFWYDYNGTKTRYASNGNVDAYDSSAALFLLVLEQYRRAGGKIDNKMVGAAKKSLACIVGVTDKDGLTWAKPTYRVKFFMDNVEVYAGLKSAEILFSKTNCPAESKECANRAAAIGKRLPGYFSAREKDTFAWANHPNGDYDGGMDRLYPQGLAQIFGVAFVKPNDAAFEMVTRKFAPEQGPAATGAERFLMAASRLGGKGVARWRELVVKDESLRDARTTYSHRPALAVLALLQGADWMPSLNSPSKR